MKRFLMLSVRTAALFAVVSLDLYDFLDGGAGPGDFVLFRALGTDGASVGSDVYAIPRPRPFDGSFVTLSIPAPTGLIKTVELIFSNFDRGTGIDNIQFQTVPEPASMLLACAGIISMLLIRRHRRLPCR